MSHRERVLMPLSLIDLPLPEKKILERQWLETNISNSTEFAFDFKSSLPKPGRITWLIGTELNSVPETMMRLSIFAALNLRPKELQYIDHSNNSKGRSVYRFDSICEKYSDPNSPYHKPAKAGKALLEANLAGWRKFAAQWGIATQVSYYKKPNQKIKQDNILLMSLNPRLGVLAEINGKVTESNRAIIADMDCATIFDLGSRKHFGLNDSPRSVDSLRELLSKTDRIIEQRVVKLDFRERPVALIREVEFTSAILDKLNDPTIGIKQAMTKAFIDLPLWQDVADRVADDLKFTPDQYEELCRKTERLDSNTQNNSLYKAEITHDASSRTAYIERVMSYYGENQWEVVGLFEDLYGERPNHKSLEQFIRECAAKDYDTHHEDFDFAFPEFAIENVAQQQRKPVLSSEFSLVS